MSVGLAFFRGKSVLITGASSGIGEELAWQIGQAGGHLTLAARRADVLEALAERLVAAGQPRPLIARCDVTREGDLERAVAESVHSWGKLDVVVANAGFGVVGPLKDLSLDDYRRHHYRARQDSGGDRTLHAMAGAGNQATPDGQGRLSLRSESRMRRTPHLTSDAELLQRLGRAAIPLGDHHVAQVLEVLRRPSCSRRSPTR